MFIDTHAHLNFKAFSNDYAQAIERAFLTDVKKIINVGSNLETSKKAVEIAQKYEQVYAAVGLHPIHVKDEAFTDEFKKLAQDGKVVAVGETGLDYYYDKTNATSQKEVFAKHLKMAQVVSRPVILHSREASEDILPILMAERPEPKGVMHCFGENWEFAKVILDMGLYISFTGLITFTKNYQTFEVIKNTPLERILIETDCPFMTPESYRGRRNEPAYVIEVARKIAELKKIPLEKVAEATTKNAEELFKLNL